MILRPRSRRQAAESNRRRSSNLTIQTDNPPIGAGFSLEDTTKTIHLEAVTLEQLRSPEGLKEARAVFRRNMDKVRHTIALGESQPEGYVLLKRGTVDRIPCTSLPRRKA